MSSRIFKHLPLALGIVAVVALSAWVTLSEAEGTGETFGGDWSCNVAVLALEGTIDTSGSEADMYSLEVAQTISEVSEDSSLLAVLLMIDSSGGTAAAAEEVALALRALTIPSVTLVRGSALSGGYWIASETDYIVASASSIVGSVGATLSYLDETKLNAQEGYTFEEIVSGDFKEIGNVNKPLTMAGRQFLQEYTNKISQLFLAQVQRGRGLSDEQVIKLKDAKFYLAEEGKTLGLVDEVGGIEEIMAYLAGTLEVSSEDLFVCEPRYFSHGDTTSYEGE